MIRSFDAIGAVIAVFLAITSISAGLFMFGNMPGAWAFSAFRGYVAVALVLWLAALALYSASKLGARSTSTGFELSNLRHAIGLRRLIGYPLLAVGGGLLLALVSGLID